MLSVSLRPAMAAGAETTQQAHHVVIMFRRRRDADHDPVEQVGISTIEQSFEPLDLRDVEVSQMGLGKSAKYEIALLRSAIPAPEQQPPAADVLMIVP